MSDTDLEFVRLSRLVLDGRDDDARGLIRRHLAGLQRRRPDLADDIKAIARLLHTSPTRSAVATAIPVDLETRLELLRPEDLAIESEPVWTDSVLAPLSEIVAERSRIEDLQAAGIHPTRSVLFVGPPGTGKTLAARWLARQLSRPLLVLDLAAVMSSLLGRTGANVRAALDHAQQVHCVLLLDEFDSIAKSRTDIGDVGELKRLVTVLLQAIDSWPPEGLLIAATNHPELLDRAAWRRFERVITFHPPTVADAAELVRRLWGPSADAELVALAAALFAGTSFANITRVMTASKRTALVHGVDEIDALSAMVASELRERSRADRIQVAGRLARTAFSQRRIHEMTGVSRDTLRKHFGGGRHGRKK